MGWFSYPIALGYELDDRGFESRQGLGIFFFTTASRLALGSTQPSIQWVQSAFSLGVKRPGQLHLVPRPRMLGAVPTLPQYDCMAWCSVKRKHRDNFTFTFTLLYLRAGWLGVLWFDSRRGLGIFLFTTVSRTTLGPTQPPIQWVPGALSLGIKRPGREAGHSPPSSAEVEEWVELYLHSLIRFHGVVLS
jgi:hypothetical protein